MTSGVNSTTAFYIEALNQYLEFNRFWVNQYLTYANMWAPKVENVSTK